MYQVRNTNKRRIIVKYPEKRKPIRRIYQSNPQRWTFKKMGHSVWNYIKIYFNHSCMHCLKYTVNEDFGLTLKLIWSFILIACNISCILIGGQSIRRFRFQSTVTGVERDFHYWNTSIPSITVCPLIRLSQNKFQKYCDTRNISNKSEREELFYFLESLANATYYNFEDIKATSKTDEILDRLNIRPKNYMETIYNLTADYVAGYDNIKLFSQVGSTVIDVRQVLTEYGICYMTNTILGPEYSTEYAIFGIYPQNSGNLTKFIKGSFFDREVTMYFFGFGGNGTNSYVHSPYEVLSVDKIGGFAIEVMKYDVSCIEIITEDNFETDVTIAQRKCRFHHESNLTHFSIYTKNLCIQECRLNFVYKKCGCIPHFYPNIVPKPKEVCDYKVLKSCLSPIKKWFLKLYEKDGDKALPHKCYCVDNCEDEMVTFNDQVQLKKIRQFTYTIGVQLDVSDWPMIRLKRQVVYSFKDLMISLGSTAGLFLGFSVLSFVELIYFFTIRLFFHICGIQI